MSCFVDFRKAYDSVQHKLLWNKLEKFGIGKKVIEIIKSIYNRTECTVKMEEKLTPMFEYLIGVRQGCIFSPLLFSLFINDIEELLRDQGIRGGVTVGDIVLYMLLYADDIVLIARTYGDLQQLLHKLLDFCHSSKMSVNVKKTQVVIFEDCKRKKSHPMEFYFDNKKLEVVDVYKYLGTLFFRNLNFRTNLEVIVQKANKASFLFWRYVGRFRNMKISEVLNLYRMMIMPILLYNCEIWGPSTPQHVIDDTVEIFHRKMLRRILGVGRRCPTAAVYCETGEFPLSMEIKLRTFKFILQSKLLSEKKNCWTAFKHIMTLDCTYRQFVLKLFQEEMGLDFNSFLIDEEIVSVDSFPQIMDRAKETLAQTYCSSLVQEVKKNVKLGFYDLINGGRWFGFKPYLDELPNKFARAALARFRCGNHRLQMEVGRWKKIPRAYRICRFCNSREIENEGHVLMECPFFEASRKQMFGKLEKIIPNFSRASQFRKMTILFMNSLDVPKLTSKFVKKIIEQADRRYTTDIMIDI